MNVSREAVEEQLAKVLQSQVFSGAQTLRRFLEFLVSTALLNKPDRIKEYVVGTEVFGRRASFDPRIDPIVRVQARRLRARLQTYYETEGRHDEIRIDIPKGGYAPSFCDVMRKKTVASETYSLLSNGGRTVAVLPFIGLGPELKTASVTSELVEELIGYLTTIEELAVTSFTSVLYVQRCGGTAKRMGRALAAHMLVEGSVRVASDQVRIFVRLVNCISGCVVWSQRYDREYKDVPLMEQQVCRAIAGVLRMQMPSGLRENGGSTVKAAPETDAVA
jgi:serine/threonine-protein kinase